MELGLELLELFFATIFEIIWNEPELFFKDIDDTEEQESDR